MLKILVVDDEKFIRKGLIKIIDSLSKDYTVIGEASNGAEAIALIGLRKPDLVIADIKMPKMDGVELAEQLEKTNPEIKKIILSGFDEFNYVRETMRNGAVDYLLKPVDDAQLAQLLIRIDGQIKSEIERRQDVLDLKIKLSESLPLLKDQFIEELVCEGRYDSEDFIREKLRYYNSVLNPGIYHVLLLGIDNYRHLYNRLGKEESRILSFIVRNIAEESVTRHLTNFSFMSDMDLVIVCSVPGGQEDILSKVTDEIFGNLSTHTDARFTLSVGLPVESLTALRTSYESACHVQKYRFYHEHSSVIRHGDPLGPFKKYQFEGLTENMEHRLKNCIEVADFPQLKKYTVNSAPPSRTKR